MKRILVAAVVIASVVTGCGSTKHDAASPTTQDPSVTTDAVSDTTPAPTDAAAAIPGPSTPTTTTAPPPPAAAPAPTTKPLTGEVPTSVNAWGATCAAVQVVEGAVLDPRVAETGAICIPGQDDVSIITFQPCDDGSRLYEASNLAWWFDGKPAHLGDVPEDVRQKCVPTS
jgi:hypothetical protein